MTIENEVELKSERTAERYTLSVIIPAFNERDVISAFHGRLSAVLDTLPCEAEAIYVNDGSTDGTLEIIDNLRSNDKRIAILDLSRNFGKEIALTAGLDYAGGDAVVVIDADLQDPPELIPLLIEQWQNGYDVVYAQRVEREGETVLKKATAKAFYRVMQKVGRVKLPENTGDYRLLSRRAVDALKKIREQNRFMKGLFAWIGFPQKSVSYNRDPRYAGTSKWNYWKLWNFAIDGITSFTVTPLKLATYLGLCSAFFSFAYALEVIVKTVIYGNPVAGYPSLIVVILFLGGVQLVAIGIIGEYLGRMFEETKRRPLYFIKLYEPARK